MKKATKVFVIIFIVFNLIMCLPNINVVFGAAGSIMNEEGFKHWDNTGETQITTGGVKKTVATLVKNGAGAITGELVNTITVLPKLANKFLAIVVMPNFSGDDYEGEVNEFINSKNKLFENPKIVKQTIYIIFEEFTIQNLMMGYYEILNIDFFENQQDNSKTYNSLLRTNVEIGYTSLRNIAIIINLLALVYTGIRMAIATTTNDKTKYKKMLKHWFVGFSLLFVLHYIIIVALDLSSLIQDIIIKLSGQMDIPIDFEYNIMNGLYGTYVMSSGFQVVAFAIMYWMLVYYQVKFFMLYVFRKFEIAILLISAPIITVTYSFDKAGDGRSQVFNSWLKELLNLIFLQNLHAIVYIIFIATAGNITLKSPILAIVFLSALTRVEKIVKNLFAIPGRGIRDMKLPKFD